MATKVKLNKRSVGNLRALHEPGKKERHWDEALPGFFLRITPAGTATYCVWIDKKDFRVGDADVLTPEEARDLARNHLTRALQGGPDPKMLRERKAEREAAAKANTFEALAEAFMAAPEKKALSDRTNQQRRENLDRYILPAIGDRPLADLKVADIRQLVRDIQKQSAKGLQTDEHGRLPGSRAANVCHGIVKTIFNWARDEGRAETNPAAFRKLFSDDPVKRTLMSDEAVRLAWSLLEAEKNAENPRGWASAVAIQLCFATLQRPGEVISARRADVDIKNGLWRIPAGLTKTNAVYEVPLSPLACRLFEAAMKTSKSSWVFPKASDKDHMVRHDLSQRWGRLRDRHVKAAKSRDARSPLDGVQLYDARRLGRTTLVRRLGVDRDIAEACINHAPDRSIANRYDVGDRTDLVASAMRRWAQHLELIIKGEPQGSTPSLKAA